MKTISMSYQEYVDETRAAKEYAKTELFERLVQHLMGQEPGFQGFHMEPHKLDTLDKVVKHIRESATDV